MCPRVAEVGRRSIGKKEKGDVCATVCNTLNNKKMCIQGTFLMKVEESEKVAKQNSSCTPNC